MDLVKYDEDGNVDMSTVIPLVNGGTEGFKGQAQVILPRLTACFECTLGLYPAQTTFPLCTIANKPRLPEHCIEWASSIRWKEVRGGEGHSFLNHTTDINIHYSLIDEQLDKDSPEHVQFLFEEASRRASEYNITGVTYRLTQGVIKNIVPAIASTNAAISGAPYWSIT